MDPAALPLERVPARLYHAVKEAGLAHRRIELAVAQAVQLLPGASALALAA